MGWKLDDSSMESIDEILNETVIDPIGPEFMAPPASGSRYRVSSP